MPKLITLTRLNATTFTVSAGKIIKLKEISGSTEVTYLSQRGTIKTELVSESASSIRLNSNGMIIIVAPTALTRISININNIIFIDEINDGVHNSIVTYYNYTNTPELLYVYTEPSEISSNSGVTFAVTTQPTRNTPAQTRYINTNLIDKLTSSASFTGLGLLSAVIDDGFGGVGYVPNQTVALVGGTHTSTATMTVATTKVSTIAIGSSGGTGYTVGDTITLATGTGTQATFLVASETGGAVDSVTFATKGSYTANPTLSNGATTTDGSGTGLTLTVEMTIDTVSVLSAGSYTVAPTNPVSLTGGGYGAKLTATFGAVSESGSEILYDSKGTAFEVLKVEESVSAIISANNGL